MADPDSVPFMETDAQDLAEVFDETHLDEDGDDFAMPEEMTDVYDATRDQGRPLPSRLSPYAPDNNPSRDALIEQADTILGLQIDEDADTETTPVAEQEIELVYTGLMRNQRGAQGSASHWEARRLSDEDIRDLGYAADPETNPLTQDHQEERP